VQTSSSSDFHQRPSIIHRSSSAVRRPSSVVLALIALYACTLSWLSLERDAAHLSNALDLGYYSNTLWNTIHGAPFRFTTYHAANFVFPEFDPNVVRKPDNLLAFHVEPILLPLSLIYAVWPDPRALLIVQSLVLASGAWPAYQFARRRLAQHKGVPVLFAIIYLISPSLVGANLSDFHPVTFSAAFGLWAFDAWERRAYLRYFVWVVLLLSLKEEMGLLVAMLGVYTILVGAKPRSRPSTPAMSRAAHLRAWLSQPLVRVGLATIAMAALWTTIAILIQRDAAGRQLSLFAARYNWLDTTPRAMITTALTTPALLDWLRQPEILRYFAFLLAQSGFAAIFAPELLLIALPEIAINAFSSFDWQRSGLAHYSAPIVPWLVIGAIIGTARLSTLPPGIYPRKFPFIPFAVLLLVASQAFWAGQLPLTQGFTPYAVSAHDLRLAGVVAQIPPGAKVSAQSDLYPHVPERADLYLFPTIDDANYILLDVTGQTYPIQAGEYAETIRQIINESPAGIVAAEDGYLLLARSAGAKDALPDSFFSFARAMGNAAQHPMDVRVGETLQLLGYDFDWIPPRQGPAPFATIRTYWRSLRPIDDRMRFVYRLYAPGGSLANAEHSSPTERWLPTTRWQPGQVYIIEQRAVQAPRGTKIGIRVESGDPAAPVALSPIAAPDALVEDGVIRLLIAQ
jgi:uncharacterized membrane protein